MFALSLYDERNGGMEARAALGERGALKRQVNE